jgi:hypothetical protein
MSPGHGITKFIGISVTPGFSPVQLQRKRGNRFNGFIRQRKAVETARARGFGGYTRLKPGVNEMSETTVYSCESHLGQS